MMLNAKDLPLLLLRFKSELVHLVAHLGSPRPPRGGTVSNGRPAFCCVIHIEPSPC